MNNKTIFVTVGTTKFEELIKTITVKEVLEELSQKGYSQLTLQVGNSTIEPDCTSRCGFKFIEAFHLRPSIQQYIMSADLVISHAGAGSCLEVLKANKPLIIVVNDRLMDNHQVELAEQLGSDGYLYYCKCSTLLKTIKNVDLTALKPFNIDKSKAIAECIDDLMGFR